MKYRRSYLDREARRLMGMSGAQVYECYRLQDHYFDIVWQGKRQCSVAFPWEHHKYELVDVGRNLRYRVDEEEKLEKMLTATQKIEEEQKKEDDDAEGVMVRDVCRTVIDKPLYFY